MTTGPRAATVPTIPGWPASFASGRVLGVIVAATLVIGVASAAVPEYVRGALGGLAATWVMCELLLYVARRGRDGERLAQLLRWAILLRFLFVGIHLAVHFWFYGEQTDLLGWRTAAEETLDRALSGRFSWEEELYQYGFIGTAATASLLAAVALVTGSQLWAMFLVSGVSSAVAAYLFLRSYQRAYSDAGDERFLRVTLLFLPAVGFWSTFMGKDFICLLLMGWASFSVAGLLRKLTLTDGLGFVVSFTVLWAVRAHIGAVVGLGFGIAFLVRQFVPPRARTVDRVIVLAMLAILVWFVNWSAVATDIVVQRGVEMAQQIHAGYANTPGATTLPLAFTEPTPGALLRFLPLGIFTLLFRPSLLEAHNVLAILTAVENLVLMVIVLRRWRPFLGSLRTVVRDPFALYVLVVFLAGAAVLSLEWNLGTMTRHRTMVMPFLLILLAGTSPRREARG